MRLLDHVITGSVADDDDQDEWRAVAVAVAIFETNPLLAAEMRLCQQYRISRSHFLGGPLGWTDEDRTLALAFERWAARHCSHCGTRSDEWVDPATGRTVLEQPYVAEPARCYGCAEMDAVSAELRKAGGDLEGVRVRLRPFDPERDDVEE